MLLLSSKKSAALLTVIIIIIILTILASVMLSLLANQTRLIEHDIARTKAKYANEAIMVRQLDHIRLNSEFLGSNQHVSGKHDDLTENWNVEFDNTTSPFSNTTELNISIDYSTPF